MTGSSRAATVPAPPPKGPALVVPIGRGSERLAGIAGGSFVLFVAATPVATAPMSIAGGLCLAITLLAWLTRSGPARVATPIDRPALLMLLAMGLATLTALDRPASAMNLAKGLIPFVAGLAAWHTREPRRGVATLVALFVSGSVVSLIGVARFLAAGGHYPARAIGLTGFWMTYSLELLLIACLALGVAITAGDRRWRLGGLATALACSTGLIASFTRSAWLGLAVALGVLLGVRRPRALVLLVPVLVVTYFALPGELGVRLRSAFNPAHQANRERVMMWDAGARAFRDHPWTGVGLQNLTTLLERYRLPGEAEHPSHVHNSYFQVAVASGVIGLAAFLVLCGALLVTVGGPGLRHGSGLGPGVRLGATAGTLGFMLAACFDHPFGDQPLLFLIFSIAGIAWAARGWREAAPTPVTPGSPGR
jgi:O-antigen ligase